MNLRFSFFIYLLMLGLISCNSNDGMKSQKVTDSKGPRKVEMKINEAGNYRLFVDGEEFYVEGAGLEFGSRVSLAGHGSNSFRTWRTDNAQKILDEADSLGMMVLMGIDVGRERHGFNYNDENLVKQQQEEIKSQVLKFKDHPALLAWGIGNELNLRYTNKKVWNAVNDISKMIHEVDGNHPTTTMLAGIGKAEVDYIAEHCTDVDFLSIQFYGAIIDLESRLEKAGYEGPYMVTEWGPTGHWEVPKTSWGAPIEQTSSEKAASIKERYEQVILADEKYCLGSYIFLWGQKQERTPTWYGLFTENGEEMQSIDVMHYFWNDRTHPDNRAPEITDVKINQLAAIENIKVEPGEELTLTYEVYDPDGDELNIRFEVIKEATVLGDGGDHEPRPEAFNNLLIAAKDGVVSFRAPGQTGPYRAFLYVLDGNNHAATVNIPFFVN